MRNLFDSLFSSLSPLWEMSLTATYAAAVVIVLRLLLKKRAPRQVLCLLWLVVFARLLIPVSLESPVSIVPDALPRQELLLPEDAAPPPPLGGGQTGPQNPAPGQPGGVTADPVIQGGSGSALTVPDGVTPTPAPEAPAAFPWRAALAGVWLAGTAAMAGFGLFTWLRLRRRLFDAIRAPDGAWEHPSVCSPFILGVFRPRIYLPAGLAGQPRQFILCHERAHLRRMDHIVKPLCWLALAIHWFNPMVWLAFILMSRDIEAACDEAVIRRLGARVKADYSATLLALATGGRAPAPCPLAFDEGNAKGRIQNVLRYRRPALWIVVVSAVMAVMAAVCLLTDPVSAETPDDGSSPSAGPSADQQQDLNQRLDPWMREVLDGERTFFSAARPLSNTAYTINDLGSFYYGDDQLLDETVKLGKLAVIDLDRDGINEMVIWPENDDEYLYSVVGYVILRRQGDTVYGYNPVYRAFGLLKADGTFNWSNSAFNSGSGSALFTENGFEVKEITWCEIHSESDERYFVDGRKAAKEEFDAAIAAQDAKPEPLWYAYEDGRLMPWLPDNLTLADETDPRDDTGQAKLWLEGSECPWLEWNGVTARLNGLITPGQTPRVHCRDFDGDGQEEAVVTYFLNGFMQLDLYEWEAGRPVLQDNYDSQDMLLRFNQNNVAGYNQDSRGLTVTYAHVEGSPDSEDYYRHYVTGSCTLPGDFFDGGYEHLKTSVYSAYANGFHLAYLQSEANRFYFDFELYLADGTMRELNYVDTPLAEPPYSDYAGHYMSKPVGAGGFYLGYDGAQWKLEEWDQLTMDYGGAPSVPPSAAPEPSAAPTPSASPEPGASSKAKVTQVGNGYQVSWGGVSYDMDPSITPDLCANIYTADFDGDGREEAAFVLWGSPIWMIDLHDGGGATITVFDPAILRQDLAANSVAAIGQDGGMTFTYSWGALDESTRRYISTHASFPDSFFQGGNEALKGASPLTISTANGGVRAYTNIPAPYLDVSVTVCLNVEEADGRTIAGRVVAFQHYAVRYNGSGFTVDVPGQLDIVSDSPQGSTPSQPAQPPAADCTHGLDSAGIEINGNRVILRCKQDRYVYTVPGPVEAYNHTALPADDFDGDGHVEYAFQLEDGRLVVCGLENGRLVNRTFDPGALFAAFDRDCAWEMAQDAATLTVSCQGQTAQVPLNSTAVMTHGRSPNPRIYSDQLGYSQADYFFTGSSFSLMVPVDLSGTFPDGVALYACWSVGGSGGSLQAVPGSFRLVISE